jgi:GDP-L-fucose synthase
MTPLPQSIRQAPIYVAGHRGLVGSAVLRALDKGGCERLITRSHSDLELGDRRAVEEFFAAEKPEIVLLCAAKVGGIAANNDYPAEGHPVERHPRCLAVRRPASAFSGLLVHLSPRLSAADS